MFWQEENENDQDAPQTRVVDLQFSIKCATLPVDHARALSSAIQTELPWFAADQLSGLHLIHGAESGNGWERPEDLLNLSRRTKLCLRVPVERIGDANRLCERQLDIAGHTLEVLQSKIRPLAKTHILYARYVTQPADWSEEHFTEWAVTQLQDRRIKFKKLLCGKAHQLNIGDSQLDTRSLMIADLPYEDAFLLQEEGLGPNRSIGCGIFVPQKSF